MALEITGRVQRVPQPRHLHLQLIGEMERRDYARRRRRVRVRNGVRLGQRVQSQQLRFVRGEHDFRILRLHKVETEDECDNEPGDEAGMIAAAEPGSLVRLRRRVAPPREVLLLVEVRAHRAVGLRLQPVLKVEPELGRALRPRLLELQSAAALRRGARAQRRLRAHFGRMWRRCRPVVVQRAQRDLGRLTASADRVKGPQQPAVQLALAHADVERRARARDAVTVQQLRHAVRCRRVRAATHARRGEPRREAPTERPERRR